MVSIALVDARKTSLTGVQNSKKIGSPLRGSWTMVSIALVDARKTSLMGVQNSKKIGSPLRGSWGSNPPPPWKKARSAPVLALFLCIVGCVVYIFVTSYKIRHHDLPGLFSSSKRVKLLFYLTKCLSPWFVFSSVHMDAISTGLHDCATYRP